jgi:hypothetical protein
MGLAVVAAGVLVVGGCASPGPPLPPSLKLPEVVGDLAATRVGDEVKLRWTTPARTTDKLQIKGAITAEICRETVVVSATAPPTAGFGKLCSPVVRSLVVSPGDSEASDTLPAALASAAARSIAYRVQLRNAAGRTAGPSAAVYVASGPAPPMVDGLHATAAKVGAVLEWRAEAGALVGFTDGVELERSVVGTQVSESRPGALNSAAGRKAPAPARFRVGGDPGGAVDRTAVTGETYRYTAERVRTVVLDGRSLEVRSVPSAAAEIRMADVFPPNAPTGLVAAPGFSGESAGAAGQVQRPAIDLSWEPGVEVRIAGYRVYRREMGDAPGSWQRLNAELVTMPAYRDMTVEAGLRYGYRVTAVDGAGNESGPGNEVVEVVPTP